MIRHIEDKTLTYCTISPGLSMVTFKCAVTKHTKRQEAQEILQQVKTLPCMQLILIQSLAPYMIPEHYQE